MTDAVITTIICTYRRPRLLRRAIESALAQTFKNIKICVYDNASGDETEAVVAEYSKLDDRVFYFRNSENIGAVNNMIQGVEAVDTEFYSLLNDDDFIFPDFYENAMREVDNHPQVGFVCAKVMVVDLVNKRMQFNNKHWSQGLYQPSNKTASKMASSHFITTGVLLRKSMRQLIGKFDKTGNDRLYMTIAAAVSPFVVLDSYGAASVMHSQSFSMMTGHVGTDTFTIYDGLLSTVETITKTNIPADRKVHLLTIVTNTYYAVLDWKKRNQLLSGTYDETQFYNISFPFQITFSRLIVKLYGALPKKLHLFVSFCINTILLAKQSLDNRIKGNWQPLPKEAVKFFVNFDTDVSKFISYVKKNNILA